MSDKPYPTVLDLERRIAALEACEQARKSPLGEPSQEMQERIRQEINAKPQPVADDAPCADETLLWKAMGVINDIIHRSDRPQLDILGAIRAGKVPGVCCDNDPNSLARRLAAELAAEREKREKAEYSQRLTQKAREDDRGSLQQKCSDWGCYWRASDAHGVKLNIEQATDLLQDAIGVDVEIECTARERCAVLEGLLKSHGIEVPNE